MVNFKVGDKVRRVSPISYTTKRTTGIQQDGIYTVGGSYGGVIMLEESYQRTFTFDATCFELEAAIGGDGELPPAPESVLYNARSDQWCSLEVSSLKANEYYAARIRLGVRNNCGEHGRVTCLTPDAALQLAHDLRRMAMEIKRKEKQG